MSLAPDRPRYRDLPPLHRAWGSPLRRGVVGIARCAHHQLERRRGRARTIAGRVPNDVVAERNQHRRSEVLPWHAWSALERESGRCNR